MSFASGKRCDPGSELFRKPSVIGGFTALAIWQFDRVGRAGGGRIFDLQELRVGKLMLVLRPTVIDV